MTILDGKNVSAPVKERVKNEALNLKNQGIEPALAVILVGEDKASQTYVAARKSLHSLRDKKRDAPLARVHDAK